jgi:hypothetical protein
MILIRLLRFLYHFGGLGPAFMKKGRGPQFMDGLDRNFPHDVMWGNAEAETLTVPATASGADGRT